ncbi:MAG: acyltransferase [Pseudomonadota bacterium]|nr:acyltransferase [Pseudomonadota bacterium]
MKRNILHAEGPGDVANRGYQEFRKTAVFSSLDGLRGLSILAVIWHHAGTQNNSWRLLDRGFLGVDLFFVISGFLIVTLLLREQSDVGKISLQKFYVRRTLRIFPLYYGVILFLAFIYGLFNRNSVFGHRFLSELPYYLSYTANFVPIVGLRIVWSLATEEQFYLVWPSIEKYLAKYVVPVLIFFIALNQFVSFGRNAISDLVGSAAWTQWSISQATFTPILLGVGAAHLLHSERGYRLLGCFAANRWASALCFLILVGLATVSPIDISGLTRLLLQLGMTALLVSCVYREDHALRPLLQFSPLRRIGKISYGMYLLHIPLLALAVYLLHSNAVSIRLYAVEVAITIVAAEFSFRFFESPILRLKRKYSAVHTSNDEQKFIGGVAALAPWRTPKTKSQPAPIVVPDQV